MIIKRILFNSFVMWPQYVILLWLSIQHINPTWPLFNVALFVTYMCCCGGAYMAFSFANFTFSAFVVEELFDQNWDLLHKRKTVMKYGLFYWLYMKLTKNYYKLYLFLKNEK